MIFSFQAITLLVIGLADLIFTIFVFVRYLRSTSIILFGLISLSATLWVFTNALSVIVQNRVLLDLFARGTYFSVIFLFPLLYLFTLQFPFPHERITGRLLFLTFFPGILFSCILFFSHAFIVNFSIPGFGREVIHYGPQFWALAIYLAMFFLMAIYEMVHKIPKTDGVHRWQLQSFLIGVIVAASIGFTANLVLPYFYQYYLSRFVGPGSTIIWMAFCIYIIRKPG